MKRSEIRKDHITNRYVVIAPGREKRPHQFTEKITVDPENSPFLPSRLKKSEILDVIGRGNNRISVIKNKFPAFEPNNPKAYGFQEVVVETPDPTLKLADVGVSQLEAILNVYARRIRNLFKKPRVNYVIVFKNEGLNAGASLSHAHSQIFGTEIIPTRVLETEERLMNHQIEQGVSLYTEVLKKEMKSTRRIYEDKHIAVFCPYASFYEHEVWLLSKRKVNSYVDLNKAERASLAKALSKILKAIKQINAPYNFFFHETKAFSAEHFCLKVQPRTHVWAGIELDSSMTVNSVVPEDAAKMYRKSFKKA